MKINDIANSILAGLDNIEVHTPFSNRLSSEYLRQRKEIVLEHLRGISQQAVQADAEGCCVCEVPLFYSALSEKCKRCGLKLRTA